jgi:type IV fimbrial biogenesis protein FimT
MDSRQQGLTLIELMVTLAVAIVILAIGIPAFNAMSGRDMSAATVNAIVAALQQARVEALSRGGGVSVVSTNWNVSWNVQLADGTVLRRFEAPRPTLVKITGGVSPVTFDSLGERSAPSATPTFTVLAYKDPSMATTSCVKGSGRRVIVELVGQVRLEDASCP